jgi:hypothetical protein
MKTTIQKMFFAVLFCYALGTSAQKTGSSKLDSNIPVIVGEIFNATYPGKDPVWFSSYQGDNNQVLVYIAKFIFDKRYCQAIYERDGKQLAFAATVDNKELPLAALNYMNKHYPAFPIVEALLVTDSLKEVTYEIGIYIDYVYVIQVFSKEGDFIKNTKA